MVNAWYIKDNITNKDDPNHLDPPKYVSLDELKAKTGVVYWEVDADNLENNSCLKKICDERGYSYRDEVWINPEKLPNFEEKLKVFFQEHLHADEEIRFILDGQGYFDIRDTDDKWIRVKVEKNDLITLPPGIYHRFTLGEGNNCRVMRLFVGEPVWTAHPRPAEDHPARSTYLELAKKGFVSVA